MIVFYSAISICFNLSDTSAQNEVLRLERVVQEVRRQREEERRKRLAAEGEVARLRTVLAYLEGRNRRVQISITSWSVFFGL